MTDKHPAPPEYLCDLAAQFWRDVATDWSLDPHQYYTLRVAADALHTMETARETLTAEGFTYSLKGMVRPHPAASILRDSRIAFLRATRELGLDYEVPEESRPLRLAGTR